MTTNYTTEYARYEHRWSDLFGDVQIAKYGIFTIVGMECIVLRKLTKVQFVMLASAAEHNAEDASHAAFMRDVLLLRTTGRMVDGTEAAELHQVIIEE